MAPEEVCSVIFFETAKGIVSGSDRLPTQGLTGMAGRMTVRCCHYNYPSNFRRKNCNIIVTRHQMLLIIHESANQNVSGVGKMTNEMSTFCW